MLMFRQLFVDRVGIEDLEDFKLIPKHDFLDRFLKASQPSSGSVPTD
jgi:hypothetical protein